MKVAAATDSRARACDPIFAAEGFAKRFGETEVLKAAAVRAYPGRVSVLLGRNGSGKSTLLRCALGLTVADTGSLAWRHNATLRPRLANLARDGLFFVPDRGLAIRRLRVGTHLRRLKAAFPESRKVGDWDPLDIAPFVGARVSQLSGGERKRVELTLGLARNPACLIADEPLAGLAPKHQALAVQCLRETARQGAAVLVTGHEVELLLELADEVVWIVAGGTRSLGPPRRAWTHPEFSNQYLGKRRRINDPGSGPASGMSVCRADAPDGPRPGRPFRIWLRMMGSAAAIWVTIRALAAVLRVVVEGGTGAVGPPPPMGISLYLVAACVFLAWLDHRRQGAGLWLANLGVGPQAALLVWGLTCLALELLSFWGIARLR